MDTQRIQGKAVNAESIKQLWKNTLGTLTQQVKG